MIAALLTAASVGYPVMAAEEMVPAPAGGTQAPVATPQKESGKESIEPYTAEQQDEAVTKAQSVLDAFDVRMEKLEDRIKEKKAQWGEKITKEKEEELAELKGTRAEMTEHVEALRHTSKKAWDVTKNAFIKAYRKLERKFDHLRSGISEPKRENYENQNRASKD